MIRTGIFYNNHNNVLFRIRQCNYERRNPTPNVKSAEFLFSIPTATTSSRLTAHAHGNVGGHEDSPINGAAVFIQDLLQIKLHRGCNNHMTDHYYIKYKPWDINAT